MPIYKTFISISNFQNTKNNFIPTITLILPNSGYSSSKLKLLQFSTLSSVKDEEVGIKN